MTATTQLDPTLFYDEPEPRPVQYTLISVDDHLVEPPGMFEGRLPARWQDQAPRVVETPEGHQVWEFEGNRYTQVGMNAVAGRRNVRADAQVNDERPASQGDNRHAAAPAGDGRAPAG